MSTSLYTALLMSVFRLAGCADLPVQPASVVNAAPRTDSVRVCLLIDPRWELPGWGTCVPIGNGVIATSLHLVQTPVSSLSIDGQTVPVEVVAAGGVWHSKNLDGAIAHGDDWGDVSKDWLKFKVGKYAGGGGQSFEPAPGSMIDFDRPLHIGEPIYLIGFASYDLELEDIKHRGPSVIAGRVTQAPKNWNGRIAAVAVEPPLTHDQYGGLSGGAAVVYDQETNQWVVVGLFRGNRERRNRFGPFEWTEWNLTQVVRPPMHP